MFVDQCVFPNAIAFKLLCFPKSLIFSIGANVNQWCDFHQKMFTECEISGKFVSFASKFDQKWRWLVYGWVTFSRKIGIHVWVFFQILSSMSLHKPNLSTPSPQAVLIINISLVSSLLWGGITEN